MFVDDDYGVDESDLPAASEAHIETEKSVQIYLQKMSAFLLSFPQPFSAVLIDPTFILFTKPCDNLAPFIFGPGFVGGFIMSSGLETFNSL